MSPPAGNAANDEIVAYPCHNSRVARNAAGRHGWECEHRGNFRLRG